MTDSPAFSLLNTRPAHQANALGQGILAMGGEALNCPTIEIQWLEQKADLLSLPAELSQIDKIIFTSVNAVQGFLRSAVGQAYLATVKQTETATNWFAIGKATQKSGFEAGLPLQTLSQTHFDSETLLAHQVMQSVQGETVLIIKGQGGRSLLKETFQTRGAKVISLDVYKRVAAPLCVESWQAFTRSNFPILLITSVESFESLLAALTAFNKDYCDLNHSVWSFLKQTIVFSQRIKMHMLEKGWQSTVQVVESQSNEAIFQSLTECLATRR